VKVGWALDFRLVPLNVDRVFVADSLVRAAFELGNPDSVIMGVDPHAESSATGNLRSVIALLLYKGKVIVQSALHKFILVRLTHPSFYMLAKPWIGTCAATVMWDALVSHTIMSQAELRGFGVYTSVELFNEVLKLHYPDVKEIPEQAKIQIVRAVPAHPLIQHQLWSSCFDTTVNGDGDLPYIVIRLTVSVCFLRIFDGAGRRCYSQTRQHVPHP
jgi:hypothetical protein